MFTKIKYGISLVLALAIVFQSAGKLIVVIDYTINKQYISKVLCENKAKPKLKCNGKCHLKKQLQKEEKKENAPSQQQKIKSEIQFFNAISYKLEPITIGSCNYNSIYLFTNYNTTLSEIFQPPKMNSNIHFMFIASEKDLTYSFA